MAAQNGQEALQKCVERSKPFDVVVTDIVMPGGISGPELARQINKLCPQTTTVYMSGYGTELLAKHGVIDPEVRFLQKPFDLLDLARIMQAALGKAN